MPYNLSISSREMAGINKTFLGISPGNFMGFACLEPRHKKSILKSTVNLVGMGSVETAVRPLSRCQKSTWESVGLPRPVCRFTSQKKMTSDQGTCVLAIQNHQTNENNAIARRRWNKIILVFKCERTRSYHTQVWWSGYSYISQHKRSDNPLVFNP